MQASDQPPDILTPEKGGGSIPYFNPFGRFTPFVCNYSGIGNIFAQVSVRGKNVKIKFVPECFHNIPTGLYRPPAFIAWLIPVGKQQDLLFLHLLAYWIPFFPIQ